MGLYNKEEKKITLGKKILLSGYTENILVFLIGAVLYFTLEIIWRGYSHIAMFFAGGICFWLIYTGEKHPLSQKIWLRCVLYAGEITAVEFIFGMFFNRILGLGIWDYSERAFDLLGQVCPLFSVLWIFVSFAAVWLSAKLRTGFTKIRGQFA